MSFVSLEWKRYSLDVKNPEQNPKKWEIYEVLVKNKQRESGNWVRMELENLDEKCSDEVVKIFNLLKQAGLSSPHTLLADHSKNSILTNRTFNLDSQDENFWKQLQRISSAMLKKAILEFSENVQNLYQLCESTVAWKCILFQPDAFLLQIENWAPKIVIDPKKCKLWYLGKYENPTQKRENILGKNISGLQNFVKNIFSKKNESSNYVSQNEESLNSFIEKIAQACKKNISK